MNVFAFFDPLLPIDVRYVKTFIWPNGVFDLPMLPSSFAGSDLGGGDEPTLVVNLFLCVILLVKYFLVVTIYKDLVAALR